MFPGRVRPILLPVLLATVLVFAHSITPAATSGESFSSPTATGSIVGVVNFAGAASSDTISMESDPFCREDGSGPGVSKEIVTDGEGHLANVFVYVSEGVVGGSQEVPAEPHRLDQKGCAYLPRVSGMRVGQTLVIRNSDSTLHNVHATPEKNPEFNFAQPIQGMQMDRTFEHAEVMVPVNCDVHPWMTAYVGVVDHPFFAVSGQDGSFSIQGLPAGAYTLTAWHEKLGTRTLQVTVGASGSTDIQFDY